LKNGVWNAAWRFTRHEESGPPQTLLQSKTDAHPVGVGVGTRVVGPAVGALLQHLTWSEQFVTIIYSILFERSLCAPE
jgi:hypothetical protein